jgi:hypothetical protein
MGNPVVEFVVGLVVILFIAWIVTGQYKNPDADKGKFITPITQDGGGEVYDEPLIQ